MPEPTVAELREAISYVVRMVNSVADHLPMNPLALRHVANYLTANDDDIVLCGMEDA